MHCGITSEPKGVAHGPIRTTGQAGEVGTEVSEGIGEDVEGEMNMNTRAALTVMGSGQGSRPVELWAQVFHGQMELMKDMLDRAEMIYVDPERRGYKRFKAETMRAHYEAIDAFWSLLQANGMVEKCECPGLARTGMARRWTDCPECGGSGFREPRTQVMEEPAEEEEVPSGTAENVG